MSRRKVKSPTSIYAALRLLERRAVRGANRRARAQVINAILAGIEAALHDAHLSGRVYNKGGEVAEPSVEWRNMKDRAEFAARGAIKREMEAWDQ